MLFVLRLWQNLANAVDVDVVEQFWDQTQNSELISDDGAVNVVKTLLRTTTYVTTTDLESLPVSTQNKTAHRSVG